MNRKRILQVSLLILVVVVVMISLHFGGGWIMDTFKEMHGIQ